MNRRSAHVAALLAGLLAVGCGSADQDRATSGALPDTSNDPDGMGASEATKTPESITVDYEGGASLKPGEVVQLAVWATPPDIYELRLSLLDEVRDASLDRGRVNTDEDGFATVELTAPTADTRFRVRVTGGDVSTETELRVAAKPTGTLAVQPFYTGQRETPSWTVEVYSGVTCRGLAASAGDTPLASTTSEDAGPLTLTDLPANEPLTVTVRYERAVSGCSELPALRPEEITEIQVMVSDLPAQVETTALSVRFDVDLDHNAWRDGLSRSIEPTISTVLDGDNVVLFLDAMAESLTVDLAPSFATARLESRWDSVLRQLWGSGSATHVTDALQGWMQSGIEQSSGSDVFVGTLDLLTDPDSPRLLLASVAGVDATQAALATPVDVDVELESSSALMLGGRFYWQPSRLLAALAFQHAVEEHVGAVSAPEALGTRLDCPAVARELSLAAGDDAELGTCEECLVDVCFDACELLWISLRGASAQRSSEATLEWSARAEGLVNEESELQSFEGNWVGTLSTEGTTLALRGAVSGLH